MSHSEAVRMDRKGRLTIPASIRKRLGIEPGDLVFFEEDAGTLRAIKEENSLDALARLAREDYMTGETRSIEEIAGELVIDLDAHG